MLQFLGKQIRDHPWLVVGIIITITIGFSLFIPGIEFKTDFDDFTPDDELVKANERITDYFSGNQPIMFLRASAKESSSVITTQAIRDIYDIQQELTNLPSVNSSFSFITLLDIICQIEFGRSINNCSDEQLQIALEDLLRTPDNTDVELLSRNDPNEEIDYKRFRFSPGKSIDSADIKNCYLTKTDQALQFSIETYDFSDLSTPLTPVFPKVNVMEWYIGFNNLIVPYAELDVEYQISAHIEPTHPMWTIGEGFFQNLQTLFDLIKNRELLNSYNKEVYLWITPPDKSFSFPLRLMNATVNFDIPKNQVQIEVSLEELAQYGIAPQIGAFSLPAKLANFTAGTRYYQTPFLKLGGARFSANTTYLLEELLNIQSKPLLGKLASNMLQRYGNVSWEEFDEFYSFLEDSNMLPDTLALKDIQEGWIQADITSSSSSTFILVPVFYEDLRTSILSLISKDYETTNQPSAALILLTLPLENDYNTVITINERILENITEIEEKISSLSIDATGNGIVSKEINDITSEANQFIAPLIFIIIMAVLFLNFRRVSYVILPMLTLVVSTIWLFGSMALLGIPFNVIAVALVPLILGLGVDYSVHILHNYRVEIIDGKSPGDAIKDSVCSIGTAMFLAMITTVIAFLSFLSATVPPIRDFGILLALGVMFTFATALTLLPALRYILDKRKTKAVSTSTQGFAIRDIMRMISLAVLKHEKKILVIMILITLLFAYGALRIDTGFDMEQFAPEDTPAIQLYDEIILQFPFSSQNQEYILIEGDTVATVETLSGIVDTHQNIRDDRYISENKDGTQKITSIYSIIEQIVKNNESLIERFNMNPNTYIPRTDHDVRALFDYLYEGEGNGNIDLSMDASADFDQSQFDQMTLMMESFETIGGEINSVLYKEKGRYTATLIRIYIDPIFRSIEGSVEDELILLKDQFNEDVSEYGSAEATVTGANIISLTITNSLTESQILSTTISIILAALVLILVYRNVYLGIIALIPVGFSIVWILGTMFYIGYTLNALTITVTSITIGIGIDYAIHATERFRLIVDKTGDIVRAVSETISHTGGALLIAALTTALGFGVLIFAPIPPQQQFGLILAVTITYSFLTSIFILPLILYHWAMRQKKRRGYVISPTENHDP